MDNDNTETMLDGNLGEDVTDEKDGNGTAECGIAVLSDGDCEKSDDGEEAEREERKNKVEKRKLIIYLSATLLITVAIIVYGVNIKNIVSSAVKNNGGSVTNMLYGEVLGRKILPWEDTEPVLGRIPLPTVDNSTPPGAVELERIPEGSITDKGGKNEIVTVDLSVGQDGIFTLINGTSYSPDILPLINSYPIEALKELHGEYGEDAPTVLLLHTHGSEAYSEDGAVYTDDSDSFRSDDTEKNVVAVGDIVADTLEKNGIGVIHIREMFDISDFNTAYQRSGEAVRMGKIIVDEKLLGLHT